MEDVPFFEVPTDSLKQALSTRRKTLHKQESLKNMTDFQLKFEVAEVKLFLKISLKHSRTLVFSVFFEFINPYSFPIFSWSYSMFFPSHSCTSVSLSSLKCFDLSFWFPNSLCHWIFFIYVSEIALYTCFS